MTAHCSFPADTNNPAAARRTLPQEYGRIKVESPLPRFPGIQVSGADSVLLADTGVPLRCMHASIRDPLCSPAKSGTKTGTNCYLGPGTNGPGEKKTLMKSMVGVTGFEPATPTSRT
jgi:hypothetical protein